MLVLLSIPSGMVCYGTNQMCRWIINPTDNVQDPRTSALLVFTGVMLLVVWYTALIINTIAN